MKKLRDIVGEQIVPLGVSVQTYMHRDFIDEDVPVIFLDLHRVRGDMGDPAQVEEIKVWLRDLVSPVRKILAAYEPVTAKLVVEQTIKDIETL